MPESRPEGYRTPVTTNERGDDPKKQPTQLTAESRRPAHMHNLPSQMQISQLVCAHRTGVRQAHTMLIAIDTRPGAALRCPNRACPVPGAG
jgi:hypothetical protein